MLLETPSQDVPIEWVDNAVRLAELCEQWSQLTCLAVDTEFMRTDTFYAILGLVQVSDGEQCWLLDPLAINDMLPFAELLADTRVIKIFHACSEDLDVLQHSMGVLPRPMIDTQTAAAFVGYGFSKGYAGLVGDVLGVELDKHETRSDWLRRPLTDAQCRYGAEDVYYLVKVYQVLIGKLQQTDRLSWVQSDMAELLGKASVEISPDNYYLKIKGAWQLQRDQLAVLQRLASWRENTAREKDKPRNRIVGDKQLLDIAKRKPTNMADLARISDIHPRVQRQYGELLLDLMDEVLATESAQWPELLPKPLPRESGIWIKQLRAVQNSAADKLGVAKEILARKVDLEAIVGSAYAGNPQLPEQWQGKWRGQLLGHDMLSALPDLS